MFSGALLVLFVMLVLPTPARAESTLRLQLPDTLEPIGATTFDGTGHAIGQSRFEIDTQPDGLRTMQVTMGIDDGASMVSQATLAPVASGLGGAAGDPAVALQLIEERSIATSADGQNFPLLVVDHTAGRVSCYPDGDATRPGKHIDIPDEDRLVNVPMQLFFLPLARGEINSLRFQIAACGDGPVLHRMLAERHTPIERDGRRIVEVEYGPDLGKAVAWLAGDLLPSFSFWFDASNGTYLGHRMPIHRKGPEVTLVRQGLTPPEIGID
jgi:hypothetical protein